MTLALRVAAEKIREACRAKCLAKDCERLLGATGSMETILSTLGPRAAPVVYEALTQLIESLYARALEKCGEREAEALRKALEILHSIDPGGAQRP